MPRTLGATTRGSHAARSSGNGSGPPAVLLMARAPRRGEVRHALEPLIGLDACVALQTALIVEAMRWARSLEPRELYVAHEPADAGRDLQRLVGDDVVLFPQNGDGIAGRVADAVARVSAHSTGSVFIVWPDLPRLGHIHAEAARIDLADGADLVLGPVFDGGYYLIALSRPLPSLFALPEQVWRGPDSFNQVLLAATRAGLEVGVLRWERALHRPADARAALADPLLPEAVGKALGRK
ncbi:MAG: DUF2064 domain-containing protein [Acidobacteriota bacterium]|nr:DUF2064 domain-containing protein [Acidobacteriota bacterium]